MAAVHTSPLPTETWYSKITSFPSYVGKVIDCVQQTFEKTALLIIPSVLGFTGTLEKRPLLEIAGANIFCYLSLGLYFLCREDLVLAKKISEKAEQITSQEQIDELIEETNKFKTSTRMIQKAVKILEKWNFSTPTSKERTLVSETFKDFVREMEARKVLNGSFALISGAYAAYTAFWAFQKGGA